MILVVQGWTKIDDTSIWSPSAHALQPEQVNQSVLCRYILSLLQADAGLKYDSVDWLHQRARLVSPD